MKLVSLSVLGVLGITVGACSPDETSGPSQPLDSSSEASSGTSVSSAGTTGAGTTSTNSNTGPTGGNTGNTGGSGPSGGSGSTSSGTTAASSTASSNAQSSSTAVGPTGSNTTSSSQASSSGSSDAEESTQSQGSSSEQESTSSDTTGNMASLPLGNEPVKSAGCGSPTSVTNGAKTITSEGTERRYIIDIPSNYDPDKPYRFFYTSHWINARAEDVVGQNFYALKPKAEAAGEPAIFLAPQALPGNPSGTWDTQDETDHILFDDILAFVKENLCIDETRVFAIGFSFGGMMTYSLSVNHQQDIRAGVGIAPANYNIYKPQPTNLPIAWMQTTGLDDGTTPWIRPNSQTDGAKFIALEHAEDNGCTLPADVPTWQNGDYFCYDFEGCPEEYPVKACTYSGGHESIDSRQWISQEAWDFFTQF